MEVFDFEQELLAMRSILRCLAYRLTSDAEEVDDLVQETMLKALSNRKYYHEHTNFRGWVYTIMRHIFINHYRIRNRYSVWTDVPDDEELSCTEDIGQEEWQVEMCFDCKELRRQIGLLPPIYRDAVLMYLDGFKYREIADKTGVSINTVKSRIFLGKKLLKKLLDDFRE